MNIVVAGSQNVAGLAVMDFTNPGSPTSVLVQIPFGGCVVDCGGTLAAVGNFAGGNVALYDISNPAVPVAKGSLSNVLSSIGAVSIDGSRLLVGEQNGQRVALIDISNPASPAVITTFTTSIASVWSVSLSGNLAVVTGPNDFFFVVLNFSNPTSPTEVKFVPGTGGVSFGGPITGDLDGTTAALADGGDGNVYLFNVGGAAPVLLGSKLTTQAGISSISISGTNVAAGSTNDNSISLVGFQNAASPTESDFSATGLAGGATVKPGFPRLA